ncbi:MAG: iron uptake porin, partial [Coleofasciculus sp. S288]|nr:iron uptake porin [Coleofasciculus sp. S288]
MPNTLSLAVGILPTVLGVALLWGNAARAEAVPVVEQLHSIPGERGSEGAREQESDQLSLGSELSEVPSTDPLSHITPVSELSDIEPVDWEFQVLQSLGQRYGCLSGYPDGTFRGNRPLTRYEFAVALKACLSRIQSLTGNLATSQDLATWQRLAQEFEIELTELQGRIEKLEEVQENQFSTTTKLQGEATFALSWAGGGKKADGSGEPIDDNITFGNEAELTLSTSFTGEDRLRLRLRGRSLPELGDATGTEMARLGFEGDDDGDVELSKAEYRFPVGDDLTVYVAAEDADLDLFLREINPNQGEGISRFGEQNPIVRQGGDAGVGMVYEFGDVVSLSLGYSADDASEPKTGLTAAPYGAIAQLTFTPNDRLGVGLVYVRSFNIVDTGTGSDRANDPFDDESEAIVANSYGLEASYQFSKNFVLGGWLGFTQARALDLPDNPEANIFNYALTLTFPDLGREGNLGGIILGQPPKVINNDFEDGDEEY